MPELPEVETIANRLKDLIVGKTISKVVVMREKSFSGDVANVKGQKIIDVIRRAKIIQIKLSNNFNILVHLKMTGQFIYIDDDVRVGGGHPSADWINELPGKHTRITYFFTDGSKLFFNDMRVFGWNRVLSNDEVREVLAEYGPDVNTDKFTASYLAEKINNKSVPIKLAIMDNAIVSGIGNIYACDALHLAKISPQKSAKLLSNEEIKRLVEAAKLVINLGIKLGGATMDNYRHVDGFSGRYQEKVRVYGRVGEVCSECGSIIEKVKLGGRGTFYCPVCQA